MRGIAADCLGRRSGGVVLAEWFTGIGIGCELLVVAAGNLDPYPVAALELLPCRPDLNPIVLRVRSGYMKCFAATLFA